MSKQSTATSQLKELQDKYDKLAALVKETVTYAYGEGIQERLCETGQEMLSNLAVAVNATITSSAANYDCYIAETSPMPAETLALLRQGMLLTPSKLHALVGDNLTFWVELDG